MKVPNPYPFWKTATPQTILHRPLSIAVEQVVACTLVMQRARVRSPVGTSFLSEVFRGFSSPVRQMSESFRSPRSPNIIWPSLSSILIHYGCQWPEMLTRPKASNKQFTGRHWYHIHIDMDNGRTPVASDKLSRQATSWRQHRHLRQWTETIRKGANPTFVPWYKKKKKKLHIFWLQDLNWDLPNVSPVNYHRATSLIVCLASKENVPASIFKRSARGQVHEGNK